MNTRFLLARNILEDLMDDVPDDTAEDIRDILDDIGRLVAKAGSTLPVLQELEGGETYADVLAESLRRVARSLDPSQRIH